MNRKQQLTCAMFRRVQKFGNTHGQTFSKASTGGKAFATVSAAMAEIERLNTASVHTDDDGLTAKVTARAAIVDLLKEVRRTSRQAQRSVPKGTTKTFRVPRWSTDEGLVTAARAVIRDGQIAAALVAPLGMSDSFVGRLETLVDQFVDADAGRDASRLDVAAARAGLAASIRRAADAVRTLDFVVANAFKKDTMGLAEWARARRLVQPHAATTDTPPTPTPEPAPPVPSPVPVVVNATPAAEATFKKVS